MAAVSAVWCGKYEATSGAIGCCTRVAHPSGVCVCDPRHVRRHLVHLWPCVGARYVVDLLCCGVHVLTVACRFGWLLICGFMLSRVLLLVRP